MAKFNEEMVKAGVMLNGNGLQPSSKGARVRFSDDKRRVIDGPFAETKELVAGYWILQCKSLVEAIEWIKRCPNPHNEDGEIEIRQLFELEDFGRQRHTSNSSPIRFIGQAPLPEFDYSQQPLPDNIRVLLWLLDDAERLHHLARSWRAPNDLHVEVEGGDIMVTPPGTRYAVTHCKPTNSRQLQGNNFPEHVDRRSPISQAAFVGKAWKLATDKARELGWIV